MNKASERYNTKVEIPISVILETIFSDDNHDVETLCRWAKHYGFVDLIKENEKDKLGYYKLQDDYTKQSFYVLLDKKERKQYDYEDYLLDELEEKDKEIEKLNNIIDKINKLLECDTNCENIYYAIGVLLNHNYFDIEDIENEEILNILKEGK